MVEDGTIVWQASRERRAGLNITRFLAWLGQRGHRFEGYQEL
jgi:hypothetical protein